MADFATNGLRPLDNTTVTDRPSGPMLDVGEIAKDYSERGTVVESAVKLGTGLIEIHRHNQYNEALPKYRDALHKAEEGVQNDPKNYASSQNVYGSEYAGALNDINNNPDYSDQVKRWLKQSLAGDYGAGQWRINQWRHGQLVKDVGTNIDNNIHSAASAAGGSGAGSQIYNIQRQNITDAVGKGSGDGQGGSIFTPAAAQARLASGYAELAGTDIDTLLKKDPNKAVSLIGTSWEKSAYHNDLSKEQWTRAYGAGQKVIKAYQAQQVAGTAMKIQATVDAGINAGKLDTKALKALTGSLPAGSEVQLRAEQLVKQGNMAIQVNAENKDASFPQMAEKLKQYQEAAKTTDPNKVEDAETMAAVAQTAYQKELQQYAQDPNGYVTSRPSVQAAVANSGFAAGTPGYIQAGVRAIQLWDKQNGMTTPTPLFSPQEAALIKAKYSGSSEDGQNTLLKLQHDLGPFYGAVQDQLFGKNGILPASAAVLDPKMDPNKYAQVHELDRISLATLQSAVPSVKPGDMTASVKSALVPWSNALGNVVVSPGAQTLITKLAYKLMSGTNPQDQDMPTAITDAIKTVYGDRYQLSGGIAYPKDMTAGDAPVASRFVYGSKEPAPNPNSVAGVNTYLSNVMLHVELNGLLPGSGAESLRRSQYIVPGGSTWLYQPNNESWEWVNNSGAPISGPGGKPVVVTRAQIVSGVPFQNKSPAALEKADAADSADNPETDVPAALPAKKEIKEEKAQPKPVHLKIRR